MAEFKLVIANPKSGKCQSKQVTGKEAEALLGKNIGEKVEGGKLGFTGYEFEVTGGSDLAGFPMRKGVKGFGRKKLLVGKSTGFQGKNRWKKSQKGLRIKKTVCGEKIYPKIIQVNLKILKEGKESLEPKAEKKEEAPKAEEKPKKEAEKPSVSQKPKVSEKPAEKPEEKK